VGQHKKSPVKRPGKKRESDWGVADSNGSRKGLSEPTPGYSAFTKKVLLLTIKKRFMKFFILIKDYAGDMSKGNGQTVGKPE
jgi:hypothetical protein